MYAHITEVFSCSNPFQSNFWTELLNAMHDTRAEVSWLVRQQKHADQLVVAL